MRVVVEEHAQVRRRGLFRAGQRQEGAGRKVHHPQLVDQGHFESLGRTAEGLAQQITAGALAQIMSLERRVNRIDARQRRMLLLPLAIEHFDGNGRMRLGLRPDQWFQLGGEFAGPAPIGAAFGR